MTSLRRSTLMAVAAAALILTLAQGPAAAAAPSGPRLAVTKLNWNPYRVKLITVGPDGSAPLRLVSSREIGEPLASYGPLSWSPDGAGIAASGFPSFSVVQVPGGGLEQINAVRAEWPVYAPDGNTVAFSRGSEIWTIDLTTWEQRRLTPARRGVVFTASSFSPDGATLLATRADRRRELAEPVALDLATGRLTRLLRDGLQPVYSPDGSRIALLRKVGKRRFNDLFALDAASGAVRRLTRTSPGYELFPSWDPSGERIAFARYRGRHFEWANSIVQINADGSCETEILAQRRTVYSGPAWQPGPGRGAGRIKC